MPPMPIRNCLATVTSYASLTFDTEAHRKLPALLLSHVDFTTKSRWGTSECIRTANSAADHPIPVVRQKQ